MVRDGLVNIDEITIEPARRLVKVNGKRIELAPKEYALAATRYSTGCGNRIMKDSTEQSTLISRNSESHSVRQVIISRLL
jgi:DNA-binding response OmpR family regulator